MKKLVLLSAVVLTFGASVRADVDCLAYSSMSVGVIQFSPYGAAIVMTPHPAPYLLPTVVYGLSPLIVVSPLLTPHVIMTSPVIVVETPHVLPTFGTTIIGVQTVSVTQPQDASITMITDVR